MTTANVFTRDIILIINGQDSPNSLGMAFQFQLTNTTKPNTDSSNVLELK